MLTYKSYYNIAASYLCDLISRKESNVNTRFGSDHHQLIISTIGKDCSNTFLERSFIYECEWNKLMNILKCQFGLFQEELKQCYLHNNMELTGSNNVYIIIVIS